MTIRGDELTAARQPDPRQMDVVGLVTTSPKGKL
jgi:hypothetical protein